MAKLVLIEWDGSRPPTTWYNRIHKLGIFVGSKDTRSPLERRKSQRPQRDSDGRIFEAVAFQEGAIVVDDMITARTLAHLAKQEYGAKSVMVADLSPEELYVTPQDQAILEHIHGTLGRRGRPTSKQKWVVFCREEMMAYEWEGVEPYACPSCGSLHITWRSGEIEKVNVGGITDLWDAWFAARFLNKTWEWTESDPTALPPTPEQLTQAQEGTQEDLALSLLKKSTLFKQVAGLDQKTAFTILDKGYRNLSFSDAERQDIRLKNLTQYFSRANVNLEGIRMYINQDVDALDVLDKIGLEMTIRLEQG